MWNYEQNQKPKTSSPLSGSEIKLQEYCPGIAATYNYWEKKIKKKEKKKGNEHLMVYKKINYLSGKSSEVPKKKKFENNPKRVVATG